MRVTKIYFPMVTAIKLEGVGMKPKYYTCIPGEPTYPSEDVILDELDWLEALEEAKEKGARIEVHEVR